MTDTARTADSAGARRSLAFFGVAVAVVVAGLLAVALDDSDGSPDGDRVEVVGPEDGVAIEDYIDAREGALRDAGGTQVAVVSLTGYEPADAVDELTRPGHDIRGVLVAVPGDAGRVAADVEAARAAAAAEAEAQLEEIEQIEPTVDDPEFAEFYRTELDRYRRVLDSVDRDDVVFGFVVRAPSADLRELAARPGVRLVDVAGGDIAADVTYRGLLPDEAVRTGEPRFRR